MCCPCTSADHRFMIVALIGPAAAGKSSIATRLDAAGDVRVLPTWTTRPPRGAETAGCLDHRFCSDSEFDELVAAGGVAATGRLPGLSYRYGLPVLDHCDGGRPLLVLARAQHVAALSRLGHRTVVYHLGADVDHCRLRLADRRTDLDEAVARAASHAADLANGRRIADRVFRNEGTLDDLASAVGSALTHDRKE
jgi:guanylate kinase